MTANITIPLTILKQNHVLKHCFITLKHSYACISTLWIWMNCRCHNWPSLVLAVPEPATFTSASVMDLTHFFYSEFTSTDVLWKQGCGLFPSTKEGKKHAFYYPLSKSKNKLHLGLLRLPLVKTLASVFAIIKFFLQ